MAPAPAKPTRRVSRKQTMVKKQASLLEELPSDLEEKTQLIGGDDDGGGGASSSGIVTRHFKLHAVTKVSDPESTVHKALVKPASDANVQGVPMPIPGTGILPPSVNPPPGIHSLVSSPTGAAVSAATFGTGFSPLPSFGSVAATTTLASMTATSATDSGVPSVSVETDHPQSQPPKHLPTVIVVLILIGVVSFLLGTLIMYKSCTRPRKRTCPTPSLPILQDDFREKEVGDEESFFGGQERASARGSAALWTWTQYTQPNKSQTTVPGILSKPSESLGQTNQDASRAPHASFNAKTGGPFAAPVARIPPPQNAGAFARAAKRVSAISASIYPGSPQSQGIGLAFGGTSPLTADGTSVLQRSNSKLSPARAAKNRRSVRYSMYGNDTGDSSSVYGGVQALSPVPPPPKVILTKANSLQGRARVKAPYNPNSLIRASSTMSAVGDAENENPFDDSQSILPPITPAPKTDALRERDTRALASAMGLASPPPPSPNATLYPDDSITLAGTRRQSRIGATARPHSAALSPGMEASARLGNLMLEEFTSMTSFPSARTLAESAALPARSKSTRKRTDDKPPRVPSPPPIPSLAQMALAHTNPTDFTDYKSPTYSIYGLYEADRKSRAPGEGGY